MKRSLEELAIAETAKNQAKDAAAAALARQQNYASSVSIKRAQGAYEKTRPEIPKARAGALETRTYAMLARQHADHANQVAADFQRIPQLAAAQSNRALQGWIQAEAEKSAEKAAMSPKEAAQAKKNKIAAAVAAAAEPYHLALIRNQKFATEAYAKAKTAQASSKQLQTDAKKMALKAQELQAAGVGVEARAMMQEAHGMMSEADNLQQWALKLYNQANTASTSAGGYTLSEQQAAANVGATAIINAPMKLPAAASL